MRSHALLLTTCCVAVELVSRSPGFEAHNVDPESRVVLTFDEAVQKGVAGDVVLIVVDFPAATVRIPILGIACSVTGDTLTVTPPKRLAEGYQYTVIVESGAVRSATSDAIFEGLPLEPDPYLFWVADVAPPTVESWFPSGIVEEGLVDVSVTFSEPVFLTPGFSGAATIRTDGSNVRDLVWSHGEATVVGATFAVDVMRGTRYYVDFPSGMVRDVNGNGNDALTWDFAAVRDATPPTILGRLPSPGGFTRPQLACILTLSEPVQAGPGEFVFFPLSPATASLVKVPASEVEIRGSEVTVAPRAFLTVGGVYEVRATGVVLLDLVGNSLEGIPRGYRFSVLPEVEAAPEYTTTPTSTTVATATTEAAWAPVDYAAKQREREAFLASQRISTPAETNILLILLIAAGATVGACLCCCFWFVCCRWDLALVKCLRGDRDRNQDGAAPKYQVEVLEERTPKGGVVSPGKRGAGAVAAPAGAAPEYQVEAKKPQEAAEMAAKPAAAEGKKPKVSTDPGQFFDMMEASLLGAAGTKSPTATTAVALPSSSPSRAAGTGIVTGAGQLALARASRGPSLRARRIRQPKVPGMACSPARAPMIPPSPKKEVQVEVEEHMEPEEPDAAEVPLHDLEQAVEMLEPAAPSTPVAPKARNYLVLTPTPIRGPADADAALAELEDILPLGPLLLDLGDPAPAEEAPGSEESSSDDEGVQRWVKASGEALGILGDAAAQ